jgi:hypothetical protein
MTPDADKLPEGFRAAHAVHGSFIFGRIVKEPQNPWESVYAWEGGPLALCSLDQFKSIERLWKMGMLFDAGEPRLIRMYAEGGDTQCVWARVEVGAGGARIIGWPEDQRPPRGYVR